MIAVPPHQYRAEARRRGLADQVIENALAQAASPMANGAPVILTLGHLARRMDVSHAYLRSVIANHDGAHYREHIMAKRSGGIRRIAIPEPGLMAVQRWIAQRILKPQPVHPNSFAYAEGSSIVQCARRHVGAGWLLKLDIHDFFESIQERSVYRVFRGIGYQPLVAFELARLCTRPWVDPASETMKKRIVPNAANRGIPVYRRKLTGYVPQGAPTSPMLSNLVCTRLDKALTTFAAAERLTFSRYSDDLTFSGSPGGFKRGRAVALAEEVRHILARDGFRLHEKKVSIIPPGGRKVVLGLLVDGGAPRLSPELRSRLADHVRGVEKFGIASHADIRGFAAPTGMVNHIGGLLRWARDVEPIFAQPLRTRFEAALKSQNWTPTD